MSEKKKFGGDEPRKGFSFSTEKKVESVEAPAPVVEAPKEEPKAVAKEPAVLYGKAKLKAKRSG